MNNKQLSALLEKYLEGNCTPEESSVVTKWYESYQDADEFTDLLNPEEKIALKMRIFKNIQTTPLANKTDLTVHTTKPIYQTWFFRIAVAASLLLSIKFLIFNNPPKQASVQMVQIKNRTKSIYKQLLPDHSIVYLSPEATLTFPKTFASKFRKVSMSGDCFFEVTKNPDRPFIISSSRIITKVWGTSFRVFDQKSTADASVTVLSGKVSVSKNLSNDAQPDPVLNKTEVILYAKERAIIDNNHQALVKESSPDLSSLKIWQHVDLSFNGTQLEQIVKVLNERFDANIELSDEKMGKATMNADLNDLNLSEILDVLKASMNLDYQIEAHRILLNSKN